LTRFITFQLNSQRRTSFSKTSIVSITSEEPLSSNNSFELKISSHPHIAIIGAQSYIQAVWMLESTTFHLALLPINLARRTARILNDLVNLSTVPTEYHKFANIFSKVKAKNLAHHYLYDLQIKLENGEKLPVRTIHLLSTTEQETFKEFIGKNLNTVFICSTSFLYKVQVLFVKKKDGFLHLYVDFQGLNYIIQKNRYILSLISNLLNSLWKPHIYIKIDFYHTYHLVWIAEGDKWKTASYTCYWYFEWVVISFGLTNAFTAFQQFINDIFSNIFNICIVVYLENILIYSDNMSQHWNHVKEVLHQLWKAGLYVKVKKYKFYFNLVEYLGYILSPFRLSMSFDKIKTIQNWPELRKIKDVQAFLGFTNFCHHFIYNYLNIAVLLI